MLRRYLYNVLPVAVSSNVITVLDRLYIGGRRGAETLSPANHNQFATVIISCEEPVSQRSLTNRYLHFPVQDARPTRISWLDTVPIAIGESVPKWAVLVHCMTRVTTAPTVVAACLDRPAFPGFNSALRSLENLRPAIAPSPVFVKKISRTSIGKLN
jgi:hypothetical protein